jgi:peptide/nickel transport system permease protein
MSALTLIWFVLRRIVGLAAILLAVSVAAFALQYAAPGGPLQALVGSLPTSAATKAALRHQYHLDQPLVAQYGHWLGDALRLKFGTSILTGQGVSRLVGSDLQLTLFLVTYAFIIAMLFGIGLGIIAAVKQRTWIDRTIVAAGVVGVSSPAFVTSILLLYLFSVVLPWFPAYGQGSGFISRLDHLTLPAVALALTGMALVINLTRAEMSRVMEEDFMHFAKARGLARSRVLLSYAGRNALNPILSAGGLTFNRLLFGTVLVEVTFALPGIGALLVQSISSRDIPVVQALVVTIAVIVVTVNLVTDLLYSVVDPRVRLVSRQTR